MSTAIENFTGLFKGKFADRLLEESSDLRVLDVQNVTNAAGAMLEELGEDRSPTASYLRKQTRSFLQASYAATDGRDTEATLECYNVRDYHGAVNGASDLDPTWRQASNDMIEYLEHSRATAKHYQAALGGFQNAESAKQTAEIDRALEMAIETLQGMDINLPSKRLILEGLEASRELLRPENHGAYTPPDPAKDDGLLQTIKEAKQADLPYAIVSDGTPESSVFTRVENLYARLSGREPPDLSAAKS